jgi:GTP-binding protein
VYYATQIDVSPPTIVLKVNNAEHFSPTYQRYLVNRLRELLPYAEVPIRLFVRGKQERDAKDRKSPSLEERRDAELMSEPKVAPKRGRR